MKLMMIDGNSIVNRAFYGVSQSLTTRAGQPTNAILGFLNILNKLLDDENPDALCVAFDRKAPTFRHLSYAQYKATRKGMPEELASQIPILKDILAAMNIPTYELDGWEADDLIGTITRETTRAGWQTVAVTGDKDALQLVDESTTVKLISTRMGQTTTRDMTPEAFRESYGFDPIHIVDLKALMGDASDNIPGVRGVGEKTAMALIGQYQSLDALYKAMPNVMMSPDTPAKPGIIQKLADGEADARMSYDLALIRTDAPIAFTPEDSLRKAVNSDALYPLFLELEFSKLIEKYNLTPKQGQGAPQEEVFVGTCESEVVTERDRMEALLAQWRGRDYVTCLALPELDGVCVEFGEQSCGRAALFLADQLPCYNDFLRGFFSPEIKKVSHDIKPLQRQLLDEGLSGEGFIFDTALAAYLLAPSDGSYELEKLGLTYYHQEFASAARYQTPGALGPLLAETAEALGAWMSHTALIECLHDTLSQRLGELGMDKLYYEIELPLCLVLAEMEQAGFLLDTAALAQFQAMLAGRIQGLQADICQLAGADFNINSTQQLGHILFDQMGLPPVKKTKTGYSTNAEVLEKLRGQHPIIDKLLEYRQLTKLNSTYAEGLAKVAGPDGRIHTSFQNLVTATGRLSSTEPNLQNIPIRTELGAQLRHMFVAPAGQVLVDADYSQIELRLLAHMSGDSAMIGAFQEGVDIHTITASQVFGVAPQEVTSTMRRSAKAVNFGIVYGISSFSLAQDIGVSPAQAKSYMDNYFAHYSGVQAYMSAVVEQAKADGYVSTLFGRRRWLPELSSSNFNIRSFGARVALNAPIQGTAADLIKLAMLRVRNRLLAEGLTGKLVLQVHDELILQCPEHEAAQTCALVKQEMERVAALSVPLLAETAQGKSWADAH